MPEKTNDSDGSKTTTIKFEGSDALSVSELRDLILSVGVNRVNAIAKGVGAHDEELGFSRAGVALGDVAGFACRVLYNQIRAAEAKGAKA